MKILAPIREHDELEMLLAAGADEFYCGVTPREWLERYSGAIWMNRRSPKGSGLDDLGTLRRLADDVHAAGKEIFVTLNAPYYTAEQIPLVLGLARRLGDECGVNALIVSDVNLLMRLSDERLACKLHVSSVAASLNVEAIRFLSNFGPTRVVLPRSLTLPEIAGITKALGDAMEIEVFLLNDGCAFEEGFCATTHHHSVGAFCTSLSEMQTRFEWHGPRLTARRERWLRANLDEYRRYVWYLNGNGCGSTAKGLPYGPCGLCAVSDLQRAGVASLKVVGREASAFKKMASVKMAYDVVSRARRGQERFQIVERARSLRGEPQHCDAGYMCYYKLPEQEAK
jgi:putative protease